MTATEPAVRCIQLGKTKTYATRRVVILPRDVHHRDDNSPFTLSVTQVRHSGGSDHAYYGIEEDADTAPETRAFILRKDEFTDDGKHKEFYRVVCGKDWAGCSCIAAETSRNERDCKHRAVCRALLAEGLL